MPDYYAILQVSPTAEPEVIEAAYRRLARKYHPDVNRSPEARLIMTDLNEAYEVLSDPLKRKEYDAQRESIPLRDRIYTEAKATPRSVWWRWIAVVPAAIIAAVLMSLPIHWLAVICDSLSWGLLSAEAVENLSMAFAMPFFMIYAGAWTAPKLRGETSVALAIIVALILGGVYVLAFTGGSLFRGWSSLYFGAMPVLNLAGMATALYKVRRRWGA